MRTKQNSSRQRLFFIVNDEIRFLYILTVKDLRNAKKALLLTQCEKAVSVSIKCGTRDIMNENIKLGFLCFAGEDFDHEATGAIFASSKEKLTSLAEITSPQAVVLKSEDLQATIRKFQQQQVDCIVLQIGNFPNGQLAMKFIQSFDVPMVVWAVPEPKGQKDLKLNSFCGANMVTSLLYKLDKFYRFVYGNFDDEEVLKKLDAFIKSVSAAKKLRNSMIGLVGYHTPGFTNIAFDELKLSKKTGVAVHHIDLSELKAIMAEIPQEEITWAIDELKSQVSLNQMKDEDFQIYGKMFNAFKFLAKRYGCRSFAVKCWPEALNLLGMNICPVMSRLADHGIIMGCEGDIYGTVTMLIQHFLTEQQPFLADMISVDRRNNTGLFWHCGNAAASLAANPSQAAITNVPCVFGLACSFGCKSGPITIARLSHDTDYKMLLAFGQAIPNPEVISGTSVKVKFPDAENLMNTVIYQGFEHHFSLIYGDVTARIEDLCELLKIDVVKI